jgi:hypothetical protein
MKKWYYGILFCCLFFLCLGVGYYSEAPNEPQPIRKATVAGESKATQNATTAEAEFTGFDVRKVRWGMTKNDVYRSEPSGTLKSRGKLDTVKNFEYMFYSDNFSGKQYDVFYAFPTDNSRLVFVMLVFNDLSPKEQSTIYNEIKGILSKKYTLSNMDHIAKELRGSASEFQNDRTYVLLGKVAKDVIVIYQERVWADFMKESEETARREFESAKAEEAKKF